MLSRALFKTSLRQFLGRHHLLLLSILTLIALIPALIAVISVLAHDPAKPVWLFENVELSPFVLPLLVLIISSTLLREEIRNQTIVYLVTKPISRAMIVLTKFAAGLLLMWVLAWLSIVIPIAVVGGAGEALWPLLVAGTLTALAYGAFFLALSLFFRWTLLWGLAYLILWEVALASLAPGVSQLSIHRYAARFTEGLLGTPSGSDWSANLWILLGITIVSLALAAWQLGRMEFPGESD